MDWKQRLLEEAATLFAEARNNHDLILGHIPQIEDRLNLAKASHTQLAAMGMAGEDIAMLQLVGYYNAVRRYVGYAQSNARQKSFFDRCLKRYLNQIEILKRRYGHYKKIKTLLEEEV